MTVWTAVQLQEANDWLAKRGFEKAEEILPVEEGVEDSVYRLTLCDETSLCLRLYERTEAEGPVTLAQKLAACGLATCPPLIDRAGRALLPLKGKPACLFPWIEGHWQENPSLAQIEEIGSFMGRMALDGPVHGAGWRRDNPRGWSWFEETARCLCEALPSDLQEELAREMAVQKAYWQKGPGAALPKGPIHADLFRNNVLFHPDGSLGAVIDWGFCASDEPLLYDLAIVANDWCLTEEDCALDEGKLNALLTAREAILPLTAQEKEAWPMALRLAALRFYLSRLFDYSFPRSDGGRALDPWHFHRLLKERRSRP